MSDQFPRAPRRLSYFLALFALVLAAYSPALWGGFLWDDDGHVTKAELQPLDGLRRIWFEVGASQQYYPVLHSAFWIQHRLWGDAPLGYHLVNILLHATAACLLAALLRKLLALEWTAWLAAVLFAIHPVNVESVAWISEQKNTMSAVFYLWAALVYWKWQGQVAPSVSKASGSARSHSPLLYSAATFLYVCACLSKTVASTLPAALLVVIWWKRGRIERRDVVPLLPWFAFGLAAGLFTAYVERYYIGAEGWQYELSLIGRVLLAGHVMLFYLGKLLWPAGLIFNYPRWTVSTADAVQWIYPLGSLALAGAAFAWRKRNRGPLAGLLFFGGTLFPALGFFNVYPFRYSYVADHFQYLAAIGVFVLAAAGLEAIARRAHSTSRFDSAHGPERQSRDSGSRARRGTRSCVSILLITVLFAITARQSYVYADSDRLWRAAIARNPESWLAHDAIGLSLLDKGRVDEALAEFQIALPLNPFPSEENNVAIALQKVGRVQEAIPMFERAIAAWPNYVDAHNNLGAAYARVGRLPEAIEQIQFAIGLKPREAKYRYNLGLALRDTGDLPGAMAQFREVIALDARNVEALTALGNCLIRASRWADAVPPLEQAVKLRPDSMLAQQNLGAALLNLNRPAEAIPHLERALQLQPNQPELERALAAARQRAGR